MHIDHSCGDALLAKLKSLAQLQKTVPQENQHQASVRVRMVLDECTVCFLNVVTDVGQLVRCENPELVL